MKKFLSVMYWELNYFLRDKALPLIMILGVISYSLFYALPYYNEIIQEIPTGVVDFDQSQYSSRFIQKLDTTDSLHVVARFSTFEDAEKSFYRDKIKGFVVIPPDFERDILRGKQVNISSYGDSAYLIIYKNFYSAIVQTAMEEGAKIEVKRMMAKGVPIQQAMAVKAPFEFVQVPLFNSIGGYKSYVYPVILILILHQTFIIGIGLLQGTRNERKKRYCENGESIPFTLFARSTFYILLYTIYATFFLLIYPAIFTFPIHYNLIPFFVTYLLMMYSVAFFAQTVSYWFKTRENVFLVMVVMSLLIIFIPGVIWPKESIPAIINLFAYFIPATCGIDGIIKINQNGGAFINIIYDVLWLAALTIFYFITACHVTKKLDSQCEEL